MAEAAKKVTSDRKFFAAWAALAIAGFLTVAGAWYGAQQFAQMLAFKHTQKQAELWKTQMTSVLKLGNNTFLMQLLYDRDKTLMHQMVASSDVFRVVLYGKDGIAFWSTHAGTIGKGANTAQFAKVAAGDQVVRSTTVAAKDIDGIHMLLYSGKVQPDARRNVTVVTSPIYQNKEFAGALGIHLDTTDLIAWNSSNIEQATLVLCGVFALLFLAAAGLMTAYVGQRRSLLATVSTAHEEAVAAEAEARSMAGELTKVNEDIVTLNKQLEHNVDELREAQEEIIRKGKMAQLGQLTATVAHDLRNPLGAVRTAAFLISRKTKDKGIGIEKPLERIGNGVERCDNIITELLDFSRSGTLQLEAQDFDDWVRAMMEEQAQRLPEVVTLEVHQGLAGSEVSFDAGRMQRCLVNLLTNASEAMVGKGDDPSKFTTNEPKIVVSTVRTARGVELRVTDNGPGMDKETLGKILEPLFTTKSFGVGLGLPAIEKILEQHGGGLEIQTKMGQGTTMTAWFPAEQTVKEAA